MTLTFDDIRNESEYSLTDISSETEREYRFDGVEVTIEEPVALAVSDNGHRVVDAGGRVHYIGFDGFYVNWLPHEGEPHLVK